jgi:hypothetical protein
VRQRVAYGKASSLMELGPTGPVIGVRTAFRRGVLGWVEAKCGRGVASTAVNGTEQNRVRNDHLEQGHLPLQCQVEAGERKICWRHATA